MDHEFVRRSPLRFFVQGIAQSKQCVKGDQSLVVQHRADFSAKLLMHPLSVRSGLPRSCEQPDDFILRTLALACGKLKQLTERGSPRVIQLGRRSNSGEWPDCLLPRIIQVRVRDLSLTGQDFPDSNRRLKSTERVSTHGFASLIYTFSRLQDS